MDPNSQQRKRNLRYFLGDFLWTSAKSLGRFLLNEIKACNKDNWKRSFPKKQDCPKRANRDKPNQNVWSP